MKRLCLQVVASVGIVSLFVNVPGAFAQTAPSLGSAQSFAVLAGSTVTNTGSSVISGDVGVHPGSAITGFPPGAIVLGTTHAADATALAAQNSFTTAYNSLTSQACTRDLTGQDLGGLTLTPGVYCFSSSAFLTGTLTLNPQGNPAAVFIFKIGSTLVTASSSSVALNGASPCNVFWQVGSSATLGTGSAFAGNILAQTSITLTTGAAVTGRALANTGAVTLDTNTVNQSTCALVLPPPPPGCPAITISPATLPNSTVGVAYNQTLTGSGGTAPYTFVVAAGALPTGLTLAPGGQLSGTPTASGPFSFTVRATDANGCPAVISYIVTITTAVPALPLPFVVVLALGLMAIGYFRLRQARAG